VQKPGASERTQFFDQMPKLWREYQRNTKCGERKTAPPPLNYKPDLSVYDALTTGTPLAGGVAQ
jgi:hypothetical protein